MLARNILTEEETTVDPELGYPRGYAKLCRNAHLHMQGLITPYTEGPPQRFLPYALQPEDIAKVKEFNQLFPIIESEERDPSSARRFADSLWQQLDHLGNAGFDPALFRIDPYGNVLYKNADPASPLAWEVDHWFPHSRGGKTVSSNLRLVQWQVNQRKKNKLEFLVPWWDLQLGVSVNQFLLIFLSKNSDFRQRAFSLLFFAGENEPFTDLLVADCHSWPQHFREKKSQIGLAPAAIVRIHKQTNDTLKPQNGLSIYPLWSIGTPGRRRWTVEEEEALRQAVQRFGPGNWKEIKENEPLFRNRSTVQIKDKYRLVKEDWELKENKRVYLPGKELILSTAIQKESRLKKTKEEDIQRKVEDISQMNKELKELQQQNEAECLVLEDLETVLIKHRRRLEKHRRWSEAQSSYRMCLENMIRDTMHQSVVYKEQGRLNQAACNALMARLETQKAACDASEMDLLKRLKLREDLETLLLPYPGQVGIKLHEAGTADYPSKNISLRLEETQPCFNGAAQYSDSLIIAADAVKEDPDKYGTTETLLPHFETKEECPKILQDLRLSTEGKQLEDKFNTSLATLNGQYKTETGAPKAEVQPSMSLRNPVKTERTKEKQRLSEAEQSDLDVLFVGYEYEGNKARGREEESVGENMTFVTSSEFKHSNFEDCSKGDCASRIGENDGLNKHYTFVEGDRDFKPVEDSKLDYMLDDGLEMQGQTKTAIPDAVAEKETEEDEAIIRNGKSNLDKWLQILLLNPQSKENVETENLPQIHDNSSAIQVCETNHIFEEQMINASFKEQFPNHKKSPSFGGLEKKEHEIHENPRCASASGLMVTGTSQLSCSEKQVNDNLDLIEKFEFLQLDCDDQKEPQTELDNAPGACLESLPQGNGKSIIENSTSFAQPLAVRDSEGAMLDCGTEIQHEKIKHDNFNQPKDAQVVNETPLKDNPGNTSEIREPEGMVIRYDNKEDSINFKGQESRLKRSDSIGYLSNAYSTSSLWGLQGKEGQAKGRIEEEGKFKAAKLTEEDGQQGLTLLKNGLTASIKTCTHMWKKLLKD